MKGGHVADHHTAADQNRPFERRGRWDGYLTTDQLVACIVALVVVGLLLVWLLLRIV